MNSCLYCERQDGERSNEHVISAAFGCKEELLGQVCKDCNDRFGHALEGQLINGLLIFLNALQIPGREGKPPDLKCEGKVDGRATKITLTGDGRVIIPPQSFDSGKASSRKDKIYRTFKRGQERIIERNLRSRHQDLIWAPTDRQASTGNVVVESEFDASVLCTPETNRAVAKYALNLLAFHYGPEYVRGRFDNLREQIDGRRRAPVSLAGIVWNAQLLKRIQSSPPRHVLILFANGQTSQVAVFIFLFSLFPFCIVADDPLVAVDLFKSSTIDPYDGRLKPAITTLPLPEKLLADRLIGEPRGTIRQAKEAGRHAFNWLVNLTSGNKQVGPQALCFECSRPVDRSATACPYCGKPSLPG